jgi:photosystem II stability/assembly factor-like uncharacterized protein
MEALRLNIPRNTLAVLLVPLVLVADSCTDLELSPDNDNPPPFSVTVETVSATQVCLQWSYRHSDGRWVDTQIQERKGQSGDWSVLKEFSTDQTLGTVIKGRTPGTQYSYRVRVGDILSTNVATVTTADNLGPWKEITFDDGCENTYAGCPSGTDIAFFNSNTGLLIDVSPGAVRMRRTTDGGDTWTFVSGVSGQHISLNGNTAIVVGNHSPGVASIWHTTDLGETWSLEVVDRLPGNFLHDVDFAGVDTAWAVGDRGAVLRTIDGGKEWTLSPIGTQADLDEICFADSRTGFVLGHMTNPFRNVLLRTRDGGFSWETLSSGLEFGTKVLFWTANHGVAITPKQYYVGEKGRSEIYRTTDGGESWVLVKSLVTPLGGISEVAPNAAVVVGLAGDMLKTVDGGVTWYALNSGTFWTTCGRNHSGDAGLHAVDFVDENLGFTVGDWIILKTTSGGD